MIDIRKVIETISNDEIRTKALEHISIYPPSKQDEEAFLKAIQKEAILSGIDWMESDQGQGYWSHVTKNLKYYNYELDKN